MNDVADIDWNRFEQSLHDDFGVNAVTLKIDGTRRTSGDMLWANSLCALIKTNKAGKRKICDRLLKMLIHAVKTRRALAMDECAAGMNKIVFPIIQDDDINGFVNICGRPFSNADRIYTDYIRETIGADAQEIEKRLASLTPIDPRTFKEMKHFITSHFLH
jgi:ligand-binding sensor protein